MAWSKERGFFNDPDGPWVEWRHVEEELRRLRTRAIAAEHHKVLDRLGRSSYQEVVEEKLRIELAEAQVRAEKAEAEVRRLRIAADKVVRLLRDGYGGLILSDAVAALALAATRPTEEN